MKTYQELSAELDAAMANTSPEDLAIELASYGMKFDNPSPAIKQSRDG